jgi:hypothetical protein
MSTETTCICKVNGDADAQQVKALLEANGIACALRGEAVGGFPGLTLDGMGVVRIDVAPEDVERARELLEQAETGALSLAEDEGIA